MKYLSVIREHYIRTEIKETSQAQYSSRFPERVCPITVCATSYPVYVKPDLQFSTVTICTAADFSDRRKENSRPSVRLPDPLSSVIFLIWEIMRVFGTATAIFDPPLSAIFDEKH